MKLKLPTIPVWVVVVLAVLVAGVSIGAELMWPRHAYGPPLEARTGFYAGAGFVAALFVLLAGWIASLLRDDMPSNP